MVRWALALALLAGAPDASTQVDAGAGPSDGAPRAELQRYLLPLMAVGIGALMGVAHRRRRPQPRRKRPGARR